MSSCSSFVSTLHDDNENTPLYEKTNDSSCDSATDFEAWWTPRPKSFVIRYSLLQCVTTFSRLIIKPFTFIRSQAWESHVPNKQEKLHNTAYLDGMRGLAAFAVFLCHLSYGTWDTGHVYGAGEPGEKSANTYLLQLPIIRLFYSGPPMVAIFFVISGYALSYKPLKQMRNRKRRRSQRSRDARSASMKHDTT